MFTEGGGPPDEEAPDQRLENLLEVVTSLADLDFSRRAKIYGDGSFLDGIAYGLNVLCEELRASTISRDYYDGIIRSMAEGLVVVDAHGLISDVNPALTELLGQSRSALVGTPWSDLCPELLAEDPAEGSFGSSPGSSVASSDARAERRVETALVRADGRAIEVALSRSILRRPNGIDGWMYVVQDITAHKELARTLARARDAALHSAQVTASFLANMSHEIRTPLNGVIGMAWLLLEDERIAGSGADPATHAKLEAIHDCATLLLDIVNDILDLSKLESGAAALDVGELELAVTVENLLHVYAVRAEQKGVELVPVLEPELPLRVRGDAGRLRQVLGNLVSNAVKFTERGEVVVVVEPVDEPPGSPEAREGVVWLRFAVSDTGIGIAEHLQETIFEAFAQAETATARKYGGTGLGLTISKRLVALMGGRIGCTSELGRGATFWFEVPLERVVDERAPSERAPLIGQQVLVVEDNARLRTALADSLRHWGARVLLASHWEEARTLIRGATEPPCLAVVDWDGAGAAAGRELLDPLVKAGTRVVLLTPLASVEAVTESWPRERVATLPKPPKYSRLRSLLRGSFDGPGRDPGGSRAALLRSPQWVPEAPVLVVEDNPINQAVIREQLRRLGLAVWVVGDGRQAVEAVAQQRFSIVLMDLHMPVMDGYEATERLRRHPHGADLPIVAVTANATDQVRERCLAVGMDDFLSKPLRIEMLSRCLSRWTRCTPRELPAPEAARAGGPAWGPGDGPGRAGTDEQAPGMSSAFWSRARVLVADDDPINRRVLVGMLERIGIAADEAEGGDEAVRAASQRRYGAVLMDVEMAGVDGLMATQRIRALESTERTPIIAVTGHDSARERARCIEADLDDFLTKPVRRAELVMLLLLWLGPTLRADGRPWADRLASAELPGLSAVAASSALGVGAELEAELREHFVRTGRDRLERMRRIALARGSSAGAAGDPGWSRDVFGLVTWSANLGAMRLAGLAAALNAARVEDRAALLNVLDHELSALALS
ncbi:response regulator [Paraliomyxa miuraensis]|uniref:response regulator n=1 Tax=Paraliomyxa miuraensis TaxID=376150 RepID=UPI002253834E|nr:response regulator [Paraliomyxa miuraensis]MCX4245156.1 response regulator [Paraliomyxa miuraensis]